MDHHAQLIEPLLESRGMGYVRLDGSVPQKKRQELIHQFQNDPTCMLFITTNAGATGLNLQAGNTVIKVAAASGQLVQAAFSFIGEIFAKQESSDGNDPLSEAFKKKLNESLERTADGRSSMTITLPDPTFIDTMAKSLAGIVRLGTTASP